MINFLIKIIGVKSQNCDENLWASLDIEKNQIEFGSINTDSSAVDQFWITNKNFTPNISKTHPL